MDGFVDRRGDVETDSLQQSRRGRPAAEWRWIAYGGVGHPRAKPGRLQLVPAHRGLRDQGSAPLGSGVGAARAGDLAALIKRRKENADPTEATEAIARHRIAALPVTAERAGGVPA